jgi:excisionase family DNA binding protein
VPTYTIQEVADELRVHPWTVRRWIRAGKVKVIRYGHRTVRITEDEFNRLKREGLVEIDTDSTRSEEVRQ